jgi:hypothetical protein
MVSISTDAQGKLVHLNSMTETTLHPGSPVIPNPKKLNFEPHLGFSWDPFKRQVAQTCFSRSAAFLRSSKKCRLQQRLVKTGGRLLKHARYYWLLLAEGHLTRRVFGAILRRIWALALPAG